MPPQAVIFDIGRVIIRLDLGRAFAPLTAAWKSSGNDPRKGAADAEKIWRTIQADPQWHDWQEGRLTPQQWHERITSGLGIPLSYDNFCTSWNLALDPELMLPETLFEKLRAQCRLALLSNTDPLHVQCIERDFQFVKYFPTRVYSCHVGATKPAPAIYREALRLLGVSAAETLYVDDVPTFAEGARSMGMDAICFEDAPQLRRELEQRGLRVD